MVKYHNQGETMKIYNYKEDTKEFTNVSEAKLDILESKKKGQDIYLIPANATEKSCERREGYVACFVDNDWLYRKDLRGKLQINLTTKELSTIDYIGEVKEGYMVYDDYIKTQAYSEDVFNTEKAKKISENESKRNVEYITTPIGKLKTSTPLGDLKSAIILFDKLVEANDGLPEGSVRLYDDKGNISLSPKLTKAEYEKLVASVAMEYIKIDRYSTYISNRINNCKTVNDIKTIIIDYNNIPNNLEV